MKTLYKNRTIQDCRIMAFIQPFFLKSFFLVVFSIVISTVNASTYYVATNGNDNNPGTLSSPFKTWAKLSSVMRAGDIAYIRGGVYTSTQGAGASTHCLIQNLHGTSLNYITIQNYQNESPVFDLTSVGIPTATDPTAVYIQSCSYLHIKGLRVTGLQQNHGGSGISRGFDASNSPNCIFELIEVDHIGGGGFHLYNSNDVTYLNCDAHHNDDRWSNPGAWGGADGFSGTGGETSTRTTYEGCRSWWNSDDGWDFFSTDGIRTIKNCWSFWNGYQPGTFTSAGNGTGFKLGPTNTDQSGTITKFVNNCLAFENREFGFSQNAGQSKYQLYNNTSYKNASHGYWWAYYPSIIQDFKNNVAWSNSGSPMSDVGQAQGSNNTWNGGPAITNYDFLSVSSVGVDGPRKPDGSLPNINFLKLAQGSSLIDRGINVGLPFAGIAPDKGYDEFGLTALPIHDVSLTGRTDNNKHILTWSIIADEPIKIIVIETSSDGTNFNALTTVDPATDYYSYEPFKSSTVFYRIKVTSVIDQTVYSNIVAIKSQGVTEKLFNVSTLVQSEITINASVNYHYFLIDVSGRTIATGNGTAGLNKININNQSGGMYFLQLINSDAGSASFNNKETQKVIKQ